MHVKHLSLTDFRNYKQVDVAFPDEGVTLVQGNNGEGKTNLLEAIGYLASGRSFRASSLELLINTLSDSAVIRGEGVSDGRALLVEAELHRRRRHRVQVNRQPVRGSRRVEDAIAVTTFSPDDLELVKGPPSFRRNYLDHLGADSDERLRSIQDDFDRVLRQRNTLLRQGHGRVTPEILATLDVWDVRLAEAGERVAQTRDQYIEFVKPLVESSYRHISGVESSRIGVAVRSEWHPTEGLAAALIARRDADIGRGMTTVGPHRDDVELTINGMPARTHASQGEQRSLAIALRLAGHEALTKARNSVPVLLLDDVFSELDSGRSERLLQALPKGQCFVASAAGIPKQVEVACSLNVAEGKILG